MHLQPLYMHVFDKSSVCKVGQLRRYERRIVKAIREENTRGETRGETMRSILTSSSSTHMHTHTYANTPPPRRVTPPPRWVRGGCLCRKSNEFSIFFFIPSRTASLPCFRRQCCVLNKEYQRVLCGIWTCGAPATWHPGLRVVQEGTAHVPVFAFNRRLTCEQETVQHQHLVGSTCGDDQTLVYAAHAEDHTLKIMGHSGGQETTQYEHLVGSAGGDDQTLVYAAPAEDQTLKYLGGDGD